VATPAVEFEPAAAAEPIEVEPSSSPEPVDVDLTDPVIDLETADQTQPESVTPATDEGRPVFVTAADLSGDEVAWGSAMSKPVTSPVPNAKTLLFADPEPTGETGDRFLNQLKDAVSDQAEVQPALVEFFEGDGQSSATGWFDQRR